MDEFFTIINLSLLASTVRLSTPLILAAIGGLYSERGGVINIALEGIMLSGAFTAAAVTARLESHNPWIGLICAALAGLLVALIHAIACIQFRADQVVVGTAINILFLGVPPLMSGALFESTGSTPQLPREQTLPDWNIPVIDQIPVLSQLLSGHKPIVYLALAMVPLTWYVLYRTRFGLRLRAVGENPEAADTAGVGVTQIRYAGVLISGILGGSCWSLPFNRAEFAFHAKYDCWPWVHRAGRFNLRKMESRRRLSGLSSVWSC